MYIATLKIREGDFTKGFLVTLLISREGLLPELEINAELPPAPKLPQLYNLWQASYLGLELSYRLEAKKAFVSNYSHVENCDRTSHQLLNSFNSWLDTNNFRPLKEKFLAKLNPDREIRILIQTENIRLKCLPWHLTNWFEPYVKAEIAVSSSNYEIETIATRNSRTQIRILAIIGNSKGINTEQDRYLLAQLPNSSITLLVEPTRQEVTEQLWHPEGWDILFFAGHSNSDSDKETGCIHINR